MSAISLGEVRLRRLWGVLKSQDDQELATWIRAYVPFYEQLQGGQDAMPNAVANCLERAGYTERESGATAVAVENIQQVAGCLMHTLRNAQRIGFVETLLDSSVRSAQLREAARVRDENERAAMEVWHASLNVAIQTGDFRQLGNWVASYAQFYRTAYANGSLPAQHEVSRILEQAGHTDALAREPASMVDRGSRVAILRHILSYLVYAINHHLPLPLLLIQDCELAKSLP